MALTKVTGSVIKDSVSLSGNVSVGGTLTYQDVTNVDALGIGTFRTGIKVLAGQVDVGSNIKLGNAGVITATSFSGVMSGTTGSFSGQVNVGSNIKLGTAGVVTATSFVGSGANLTSLPSQITFNNASADRVLTSNGGTAVNAEANLTMTGNNLQFNTTANGHAVILKSTGNYYNKLSFDSGNTSAGGELAYIDFKWDGDKVADIQVLAGSDTTNKDDGHLVFRTSPSQGSISERLRIDSNGVARFINSTGELKIASSTNNDAGRILFQEGTIGAWSIEAQRANGYFRILDEYNNNSGSAQERFRIDVADNGNTTIEDNNLVIKKTSLAGNGIGGITIGKNVSGTDGCIQINSIQTGSDTDQIGIEFKTHRDTAGSAAPQETMRITHSGQLLERQQPYSETYQGSNWGNAYYIKSGWMRFNSNFSNPTKDLIILPDAGNANNNMFIKVTVTQLDYPGAQRGIGAIHIGYASAKRYGDSTGKWYVDKGNMALESGSNFHGNFSNVGGLSWDNSNPSDTNTLRYTSNRVANYDTYMVRVEVWENGNCSYYLHSDFITQ